MKCEYGNCKEEALYAMFKLNNDGAKDWLNLCPRHDDMVFEENKLVRLNNPEMVWKEVK